MYLSKAEQRVYNVLKKARTLKYEQALAINRDSSQREKEHAITALFKKGLLFYSKHKDYVMLHPKYVPDKRMEDAVWLLIRQITNIDLTQIYHPQAPSSLGYVKTNKCYEIIGANNAKELKEAMEKINELYLKNAYDTEDADDNTIRYLIIVRDKEDINKMPKDVCFPYAFAIIRYAKGLVRLEQPEFDFYVPETKAEKGDK